MTRGRAALIKAPALRSFACIGLVCTAFGCEHQESGSYTKLAQHDATPQHEASSVRETSSSPRVIGEITSSDLRKFYPKDAESRHIEGVVQIAVIIDAAGRATDTKILSEAPIDMGFGAAASALAHTLAYSNPTGRNATLSFDVRFALKSAEARSRRHHRI